MQRAPLLLPALAALLAILAEQHAHRAAVVACAMLLIAASLFTTGCTNAVRGIAVGLIFGLVLSATRGHPAVLTTERPTARYSAVVTGDVRKNDSGADGSILTIDGIGNVRATFRESIVPGERVIVRGRLEPFDEPRNPGEPSMRDIERDAGVAGRLASVRLVAHAPPDPWDERAWAARLRARLAARMRASIPEPSATILAGILWGERGTLPDDLHDAFQTTGTVHVLVTAGLHLGIIAALVAFGLAQFGIHRIAACSMSLIAIIAYVWMSGSHLPSERAAAMLGVALLARACGARVTSWNALALAALVVAALWPAAVTGASFALSFSCIAAIILFAEPFTAMLERVPLHERVREALALTCATQIGTWPLTAAVFSTVTPYAVVANAVVVPLIGVIIPAGLATVAIPVVAPIETLLLRAVETLVRAIAALPAAHVTIATPPIALIAAYDVVAVASGLLFRSGRSSMAIVLLFGASALVVVPTFVHVPHGLEITHLDVGQADAAVIRTPDDHVILIDAGGELEHGSGAVSNAERAGERIVLGYLRRTGIRQIDLLILTHPHGDHLGGAFPIIEAMPVRAIFDSGQSYGGRAYRDAMTAAHDRGVPVVVARRGLRWTSGDGVSIDVLAPSLPMLADTGDDVNENSIVAMLRYRDFREIFMGDAGEASESRLLASGVDLHAAVIKVGHHGSRYASTEPFAVAVRPSIAVISVGRHNTFGHPASATIDAWTRAGAAVLRTDRCAAVFIDPGSGATMKRCANEPSRR